MPSLLISLAHARFPDLAKFPAEIDLLERVRVGEEADRGADAPWRSDTDNADIPAAGDGREKSGPV